MPYVNNAPDNFKEGSELSSYDRSLRYNDYVMELLFRELTRRRIDVLVYLSDHSDAVSIGKGHDPRPGIYTREMTEIPMWVYLSDSYRNKHPELVAALEKAKDKVFTNDLLFNLMLTLMGIHNRFNEPRFDLLNEEYCISPKNARTLYGSSPLF